MKTAITSSGDELTAQFDKRFGRSAWFCLYDDKNGATTFHKNAYADAPHGAGTMVAEKLAELNVQKIISGDFGHKAKEQLDKLNIQMVIVQDDNYTVQDIINKLNKDPGKKKGRYTWAL